MNNTRILQIESLTMDLLKDIYTNTTIIPPIDLEKVVKKSDIEVRVVNFENPDIEGIYNRSEKVIYVKDSTAYPRVAFTIAHELGHYYLHQDKPAEVFYRNDALFLNPDHKEQEQEANWFAASLLMPKEIFIDFWQIINDIDQIASRFSVSNSAAYWRLKNLGLV